MLKVVALVSLRLLSWRRWVSDQLVPNRPPKRQACCRPPAQILQITIYRQQNVDPINVTSRLPNWDPNVRLDCANAPWPTATRNKTNVGWEHTLAARQHECRIHDLYQCCSALGLFGSHMSFVATKSNEERHHGASKPPTMTSNQHDQKPLINPGSQSIKGCFLAMFCQSPYWQSIDALQSYGCFWTHVVPQADSAPTVLQCVQESNMQTFCTWGGCLRWAENLLWLWIVSFLATFGTTFCAKHMGFHHFSEYCSWCKEWWTTRSQEQSAVTQRPNHIHPRLCLLSSAWLRASIPVSSNPFP